MKLLVTVLVALVAGVSVQAQPPDFEGLRVRAEQGNPSVQFSLGRMYRSVQTWKLRTTVEAVRLYRLAAVHLRREVLMEGEGVKGIKGWVLHYIIGSIPLLMVYSSGVD